MHWPTHFPSVLCKQSEDSIGNMCKLKVKRCEHQRNTCLWIPAERNVGLYRVLPTHRSLPLLHYAHSVLEFTSFLVCISKCVWCSKCSFKAGFADSLTRLYMLELWRSLRSISNTWKWNCMSVYSHVKFTARKISSTFHPRRLEVRQVAQPSVQSRGVLSTYAAKMSKRSLDDLPSCTQCYQVSIGSLVTQMCQVVLWHYTVCNKIS